MKTSSAKAKGRNLQKWACEQISKLLFIPWGYEDEKLIQPRLMGQSGTDVVLRMEAKDQFLFDVECKATEKINLYKDIEQAKTNTSPTRNWLLIHKKNRNVPIVILDANVFFNIMEELIHGK
ncbi:MAG: hypothetical protein M0P71_12955 [Melioribacteraceae bacterium]|jgi:hypothetical protein|nr:hypothetical protein [Melioribacteraceae bacterium]